MASSESVKDYIAQWLQLGKQIVVGSEPLPSMTLRHREAYSNEYENLWTWLTSAPIAPQAYLSGTDQTISQLLSDRWEIIPCARCHSLTPAPNFSVGYCPPCPCNDLANLPNLEMVVPHPPINSQGELARVAENLRSRL